MIRVFTMAACALSVSACSITGGFDDNGAKRVAPNVVVYDHPYREHSAVDKASQEPLLVEDVQLMNSGLDIYEGSVQENIVRIAGETLGVPAENITFLATPCELEEKHTFIVPEERFSKPDIANKAPKEHRKLYYYATHLYGFLLSYRSIPNTIRLVYNGPDISKQCRQG